ncbi:MAG: hypothetical protein MI748_00270 [Opitutales bacterium]|nr:hypothetical protein [Opitutales bacterium]
MEVLIIGQARTGSTSLFFALQSLFKTRNGEPFNPGKYVGGEIETDLQYLFKNFQLVKHMINHLQGYDHRLLVDLIKNEKPKVIVTSRRSISNATLSRCIAEETGSWWVSGNDVKNYQRNRIGPISSEKFRAFLLDYSEMNHEMSKLISEISPWVATYENLFGKNKLHHLKEMCRFLQIDFYSCAREASFMKYFSSNNKMNNRDIISTVTNLAELRKISLEVVGECGFEDFL